MTNLEYVRPTQMQSTPPLRTVAFVSRYPEARVFETILDAVDHDVVFLEPTANAYAHIKRAAPDLVVVCLSSDDIDGCRLLSMLALDSETSRIPVQTCLMPSGTAPTALH